MEFNDFIHSTGQWLMGTGTNANIVMSSRIRLARNLAKKPFTNKARKRTLRGQGLYPVGYAGHRLF